MSEIADVFTELFFGEGVWLGLLLFVCLIVSVSAKIKYAGAITLPISVYIGITYLDNNLYWCGLIMFFTAIFSIISLADEH